MSSLSSDVPIAKDTLNGFFTEGHTYMEKSIIPMVVTIKGKTQRGVLLVAVDLDNQSGLKSAFIVSEETDFDDILPKQLCFKIVNGKAMKTEAPKHAFEEA